jgi:GMP synthase (glutamine-hydrolysing)
MSALDTIFIVDFGSQYTQLIARRIREMGVFTEVVSPEVSPGLLRKGKGVILSGSPSSTSTASFTIDPETFNLPQPILGICFGMQLMNVLNEGRVQNLGRGEYGSQKISLSSKSQLFRGLKGQENVWMSHGDSIDRLAHCYEPIAHSQDGIIAAIQHPEKNHFGVQFHPEVTHTENGQKILENFIDICECQKNWTVDNQIESIKEEIRKQVQDGHVISLVSGGVDSTVSTLLCMQALSPEQIHPIHIDTGLMRDGESEQICDLLRANGMPHLRLIDASHEFLSALKGVTEPEEKRTIIGTLFIDILEREMAMIDSGQKPLFFCQGTLYTDLIESGKAGKHGAVIKSHHNVNPPSVMKKREQGLIVEPNRHFFKDEIRHIAQALQVPHHLAWRHPFPGPGLAIRIIGEVTAERVAILRKADTIYLDEIRKAGLYDQIWQAFAILLPIKTVGVMGDGRTVGQVVALRAVTSQDGMTADVYPLPTDLLCRISTRIINEVPEVNRVTFDVTTKPPGTIEWE